MKKVLNVAVRSEIYLDNAATTRPMRAVMDAVHLAINEEYGNPSSLHEIGRKAKDAVENARKTIADFIGAKPSEIYFTSGGSESDNFALRGLAPYLKRTGKTMIVTSEIEHHAVLNTCKDLRKDGFDIVFMPVDGDGRISVKELHCLLDKNKDRVGLVSIMAVNNETGSTQMLEEIGELCRKYDVFFMTDAVQAYGHIPLDVNKQNISLLSVSGHKIHALKGIGILYVRDGVPLSPIITGGEQEQGLRAGTENVFGIISMGTATDIFSKNMVEHGKFFRILRRAFLDVLDETGIQYKVNVSMGVPNIISLTLPGCASEAMLLLLNLERIYVSAGSACTSGSLEPSHVLLALGLPEQDANCTIRISMGLFNHVSEMEIVAKKISECARRLYSVMEEN